MRISAERFRYYTCGRCGLVFLRPIPADLGRYYSDAYYTIPESRERLAHVASAYRYQVDLLRRFVTTGRLVEIGPGTGAFTYLAKQAGFEVTAIEMDERCCRFLREVVGVEAIHSDDPASILSRLAPAQAIILSHVVEHLVEPWTCLDVAAQRLEPGGILLVATPNPDAFQFRLMGAWWPHVDAPRHLHLIPLPSLTAWLAARGLSCVYATSNDIGGRGRNVFRWQRALMNLIARRGLRWPWVLEWLIGQLTAFHVGRGLRGSTYTAVFQREALR